MVLEGRSLLREAPWLTLGPGAALAATVLALTFAAASWRPAARAPEGVA
jgi:ABC-type dipeptide/oligopeptide/nickel transport system permease subunit